MRRGVLVLSLVVLLDVAIWWTWGSTGSVPANVQGLVIVASLFVVAEAFGLPRLADWIVITFLGIGAIAQLLPPYSGWSIPLLLADLALAALLLKARGIRTRPRAPA